jgi:hypothetical protein
MDAATELELEPTGERDPLRNCGPLGSEGPACSECARCIAEVREAENWFLRQELSHLRERLRTSGDRTENAEQKSSVEPNLPGTEHA